MAKIGKYQIVAELGRGAMGVVYKGLDPVINRFVAIKTLTRHGSETEHAQLVERFKQEAQAAGRLNHPNIVSVYEYGEDQERAFIAMEFVDGYTLADEIKRKSVLELNDIWELMLKVLDALHYAHSKGIVHRDIKPSNVMRTHHGEVKIADFGIARIESSELTQVGTVIGTPGYMSPEQLLGHRVDHCSDIFSCGILLYELLTGERAFVSTNITSTIYKVVHTELPPASKLSPTVPQAIDAVLATALAKNPADRFPNAKAFADAIRNAVLKAPRGAIPSPAALPDADKTIVIPRQPQGDDKTVVLPQAPPTDDWFNKLGAAAEAQRSTAAPRSGPARVGPSAAGKRIFMAVMGASVVAVVVALILVVTRGGDTHKTEAVNKQTAAIPAPVPNSQSPSVPSPQRAVPAPVPAHVPGDKFKDCATCPPMVVVPPGAFTQGSPADEAEREANEGPQHAIKITYALAVGQYPITRAQFAQFATATGYSARGCWVYDRNWQPQSASDWRAPGFAQTDDHPVTCVSWDDAAAYVVWLAAQTGKKYRLLSSSEWEYVARLGSDTARDGGDEPAAACATGNVADQSAAAVYKDWKVHACKDGFIYTAPVGSFQPNRFGVYDMLGNVFEWVGDCWNDSYRNAPSDGSAWLQGDCGKRELRGVSWFSGPQYARFAFRNHFARDHRAATFGFRVARLANDIVPPR